MTEVQFPVKIDKIVSHDSHLKVSLSPEIEKTGEVFAKAIEKSSYSLFTSWHRQLALGIILATGAVALLLYTIYRIWQHHQAQTPTYNFSSFSNENLAALYLLHAMKKKTMEADELQALAKELRTRQESIPFPVAQEFNPIREVVKDLSKEELENYQNLAKQQDLQYVVNCIEALIKEKENQALSTNLPNSSEIETPANPFLIQEVPSNNPHDQMANFIEFAIKARGDLTQISRHSMLSNSPPQNPENTIKELIAEGIHRSYSLEELIILSDALDGDTHAPRAWLQQLITELLDAKVWDMPEQKVPLLSDKKALSKPLVVAIECRAAASILANGTDLSSIPFKYPLNASHHEHIYQRAYGLVMQELQGKPNNVQLKETQQKLSEHLKHHREKREPQAAIRNTD